MKYKKNQIKGFESMQEYKEYVIQKYSLQKIQFKIIGEFIVIKSNL